MTIPHRFPSLIDEPAIQSILIAGAGLSHGNVPIIDELKNRLDIVANALGVTPTNNFYEVAEAILNCRTSSGESDAESRLWLAEELGLLDDRRWFGETGLPLSGNTPRHRAIARFAVEERLRAIISLNWDTLLEAALDSVGLAKGARSSRPWRITAHASVVDDTHIPCLAKTHIFPVIKPHGCVRNLEQIRRLSRSEKIMQPVVFKVAQSDLTSFPAGQTGVDKRVEVYVSECPLVAIGWKATEKYLRDTVIRTAQNVKRTEPDSFTLVSRSWYPNKKYTDTFHNDIATAYSKTELEAFAPVGNTGQPTLDCLFLWLQARFALNKLIAVADAPQQAALQQLLQQLDSPDCDHPILRWADSWLPTWVRLCWRAGVMHGSDPHTNKKVEPWDIPIMPRDAHVPLGCMTGDRRELQAAAKLLAVLGSDLGRYNFEKFLGGFWDEKTHCLYIPLPGWHGDAPSDLAALKPLVEALRGLGFVRSIYLILLDAESIPPDQAYCNQLAAQVRRLMPLANFAKVDALTWVGLEALKGGTP